MVKEGNARLMEEYVQKFYEDSERDKSRELSTGWSSWWRVGGGEAGGSM